MKKTTWVLTVAVLDKIIPADAGLYARSSILLLANLLLAMIAIEIMRVVARRKRKESSGDAALIVSEAVHVDTHDAHDAHSPHHEVATAH